MMRGSCLCGAVVFDIMAPLRDVLLCHCTQCRKTSGHFWAASSVPSAQFRLVEDRGLRWYRSSATAERGFCCDCGSSLFWQPTEDRISFAAGALDGPTGLSVIGDWFLEEAGDYYTASRPAQMLTGACLCGANQFTIGGAMGDVTACHCTQCRKTSGHHAASFDVEEDALIWSGRVVQEYVTGGGGQRGFCPCCGGSLYVRTSDGAFSVAAGCIDNPTGGQLARHIFVADKSDYYILE